MDRVEFGTIGQWLQVLAKPLAAFMCSPRLLAGMRLRRECSPRLEYGSSLLGYLQDSGRWDILKYIHGRSDGSYWPGCPMSRMLYTSVPERQ